MNIVNESFKIGHPLHKIFNKSSHRESYLYMPNLKSKINAHNISCLEKSTQDTESRYRKHATACRGKTSCPLNGESLTLDVIYQASAASEKGNENYIGLTGGK